MISKEDQLIYDDIKRRLEDPASPENKIIMVDVSAIRPYTNNPKVHSKEEIAELAKDIDEKGLLNPIIVNKNTMEIIAGHKRFYAHKHLKRSIIQARLFNVTANEAKVMRIVDNNFNGKRYDTDVLKEEILSLRDDGLQIDNLGIDMKEMEKFLSDFEQVDVEAYTANLDEDTDAQVEQSKEDIEKTDVREVSLAKVFGFKNIFVRDERAVRKFIAKLCEEYDTTPDRAFIRFVQEVISE